VRKVRIIALVYFFFCSLSLADTQQYGEDPMVEERLKSLSVELRCLVCQNQTLADSSAPLAEDLRNEIRDQIKKGEIW
jgi:cytochrome c-type biogenesis protein CcmH